MGEGLKSLQVIARAAARRSRFSTPVNDYEDETTITPRPLTGRARSHYEATRNLSNGMRVGADHEAGPLAPFQLPKLPDFSNMFEGLSDSRNVESPYYQAPAVSTH